MNNYTQYVEKLFKKLSDEIDPKEMTTYAIRTGVIIKTLDLEMLIKTHNLNLYINF